MKYFYIYKMFYRTHNCGELNLTNKEENIILSGWIDKIRKFKKITFIDLRDMYGITQLTIDNNILKKQKITEETIINITGTVKERISKNLKLKTGEIEINVLSIKIINKSKIIPFSIKNDNKIDENNKMKYRYLYIRNEKIKNNLLYRHKVAMLIRKYLSKKNFIEIETPILVKSTPEGARDFIVPSRIYKGMFYSLPQSPQYFKQLLMIGGIDRYFQIAKCFRDEDLRKNRQPEFTQIDCEMSFVTRKDVMIVFEKFLYFIFKKMTNFKINRPWKSITYKKSLQRYGTDKPDTRFKMYIKDVTKIQVLKKNILLKKNESILCIKVSDINHFYNINNINKLIKWTKKSQIGVKTLFWIKQNNNIITSNINFSSSQEDLILVSTHLRLKTNNICIIINGFKDKINKQMSLIRVKVAESINLIDKNTISPVWITDFPLFKWDPKYNKYNSVHHPFTAPKTENLLLLHKFPHKLTSMAYDIVINGEELGGGSIRISNKKIQEKIFKLLGFNKKTYHDKFGFLINALDYGCPPHGGIAIGFDRLLALLMGKKNIKNFIAFPKNNSLKDLMIDAPNMIDQKQLKELNFVEK